MKRKGYNLLLYLVFLFCYGCDVEQATLPQQSNMSPNEFEDFVFQPPQEANHDFTELSFQGNHLKIQPEIFAENKNILLITNPKPYSTHISISYEINLEDEPGKIMKLFSNTSPENFHLHLRKLEKKITKETKLPTQENTHLLQNTTDSFKTFKVLKDFNNTDEFKLIDTELVYESTYYQLFVDQRDLNQFNMEDLIKVAEEFNRIIPVEQKLFGEASDVDQNGKFTVVLTREVNAIGKRHNGLVTGYFYAIHLFDESLYKASNEQEIFFILVPDPTGQSGFKIPYNIAMQNIIPSALPHEYQHLINFNQHYFLQQSSLEKGWLNEALSYLSEDIYSTNENFYMEETGIENPSRIKHYLNHIAHTCFVCELGLAERGGSYLFLRFLYEQSENGIFSISLNGQELIQNLLTGQSVGFANINKALTGQSQNTELLEKAFTQFALSLYFTGLPTSQSNTLIQGINLRKLQLDNRGTHLMGPGILELQSLPAEFEIPPYGMIFLKIKRNDVTETEQSIFLETTNANSLKVFLIY